MPVSSRFEDPHSVVPLHLVDEANLAPALSIYYDSSGIFGPGNDYDISLTNTGIDLTDGATIVSVRYADRNLEAVKNEIVASNTSFKAVLLSDAIAMNTGELSFDTGDLTNDQGFIIRMDRHNVKYNEETRIRLLAPYNEPRDFPWYALINVGQFSKDHLGSRHIFNIPEYRNQAWSPTYGYPYMEVFGEEPTFINERQIRVARTPILWRENNIGVRVRDRAAYPGIIEDVDENNGILFLNSDITDVNGLNISYVYKEYNYVYKQFDVNPSVQNNPYTIGQFVLFYVIPERTQPGDIKRSRTVFHKVSPTLLGAIYSLPRYTYPITLLGALQVRQTNTVDDIAIQDSRTRGGGVKEDLYKESIGKNKNVQSVADFGRADGVPYPGNSVVVYNLPDELRQTMEVDDIKARAAKHLAHGVTPIVEFDE